VTHNSVDHGYPITHKWGDVQRRPTQDEPRHPIVWARASTTTGRRREAGRRQDRQGLIAAIGTVFPGEFALSMTTIGVNTGGTATYLVIADGEGIDGGNGATPNQLGAFYKDILGASSAMIVDSGESTELIIRGASAPRRVNTLTSESNAADGVAPNGDYTPSGRVFSFIKAGT
jgi:hypothetical protein